MQASAFEDKYSTEQLPPGAADPYEGMSFSEVLKAKREALDKKVETSAQLYPEQAKRAAESNKVVDVVAERKAELQRTRDAMIHQRKEERDKELAMYNATK